MTQLNLKQFLNGNSKWLGSLLSRLNQLNQWNHWLKESLPHDESLIKHCFIVNLKANQLMVIADSPHWVTRLRFHIPELLPKLKKYPGLEKICAICCKVQPTHQRHTKNNKRTQQRLSTHSIESLQEAATKIADSKISSILDKIALNSIDSN